MKFIGECFLSCLSNFIHAESMKFLFILLFTFTPYSIHAKLQGKQRIDSLLRELNVAKEDTIKASLLGNLSFEYRTIDPELCLKYAAETKSLSLQLGWKRGLAIGEYNEGLNYKYRADYPKALEHLFKALKYNEEAGSKLGVGSSISNIGVIYQEQGNYDKALEFFLKSLKINEELENDVNIAGDLGNIGIIYNEGKSDYKKALEYDLRSLKIFEKLGDKDGIGHNLGNIGAIYYALGDYKKSLEYDFQALKLFEELGDKSSTAINLGNIGESYLALAKVSNRDASLISIGPSVNLRSAIQYLGKAIVVSKEIGDLESIIEFSKYLSEAYHLSGNNDEALKSYQEYAIIKDSVYSTDSKLKIAKLETQRALEVKDKQIQLNQLEVAKRRNERVLLIILTILLLIIIGIGVREYNEQRISNKELSKEKKKHLARIQEQTSVLSDIAYTQSHEVSGQVATILGLVALFNFEDTTDPDNKVIIEGVAEVSEKLDQIVKEMIIKENNLNKDI